MTLTRTQAATLGAVGIAAVGGVALVEHLQNEAQNKEEIGEHLKNQGFDKDTISAWQESPDLFIEARSLLHLGPTIAIDGSPLSPSTFNRFVRRRRTIMIKNLGLLKYQKMEVVVFLKKTHICVC